MEQRIVLGVKIIRRILDQKKFLEENLTVLFVGQINQDFLNKKKLTSYVIKIR